MAQNSTRSSQRWYFRQFFRDSSRPEVVGHVISGVAAEQIGVYVLVKFGDSRSNHYRDIRAAHFVMDDERRRRMLNTSVGRRIRHTISD